MHELNCPCCHSENTQRVSIAYANGTKSISATTIGVGAFAGTNGTSQSLAAANLAPPKPARIGMASLLLWILALFFAAKVGIWAIVAAIVIQLVIVWHALKANDDCDAYIRDTWNHLMVCGRCGNVWSTKPIETAPAAPGLPARTATRYDIPANTTAQIAR